MESNDPISKMESRILGHLEGGPHGYPVRSSSDFNDSVRPYNGETTDRISYAEDLLKEKLKDLFLKEITTYLKDPKRFGAEPPSKHNPIWRALLRKIENEAYRELH